MNYYRRYCGDYLKKTADLSLAEHGAYTLLLDHYYSTERPLPVDAAKIYRITRATSRADRQATDSVIVKFWREVDGGLINERAGDEMGKASVAIEAAKKNGKKGGRPRMFRDEVPRGTLPEENPLGFSGGTRTDPSGNPAGDNPQPPTKPPNGVLVDFPLDWMPCELSLSLLAMRGIPKPSADVVSAFVGHNGGTLVVPRLLPTMFLTWCARQRAYDAGRKKAGSPDAAMAKFDEMKELPDAFH